MKVYGWETTLICHGVQPRSSLPKAGGMTRIAGIRRIQYDIV